MSFIVLLQSEYFTAVTIDRDRLITALCGTSDRAARVKYIYRFAETNFVVLFGRRVRLCDSYNC